MIEKLASGNISNIIPLFGEPIVIATWALAIITAFYATITFYMLLIIKRDREHKVIVEIVKYFLIPVIDTLEVDRKQFNRINNLSFPDFLDFQFGIPTHFLKGVIFDRFAKRKPLLKTLLKRKILKYNELNSKFSKEIDEFKKIAEKEGVVKSIVNKKGPRTVINAQYETENLTKILRGKGLDQKINDIIIQSFGLDKKAEKLVRKLEKIKEKFQDKYILADEELGW